jgi:multidrug transporter EmrE-like cation transporter
MDEAGSQVLCPKGIEAALLSSCPQASLPLTTIIMGLASVAQPGREPMVNRPWLQIRPQVTTQSATVLGLILVNLAFNIAAIASFKMSALHSTVGGFLRWQVAGNLAGLMTVLSLTALLRHIPLNFAFTVTIGQAILGVDSVAGILIFRETITPTQWMGTLLVVAGVVLVRQG